MNLKIQVKEVANGYVVNVENSIQSNGVYAFRTVDDTEMLEFVGKVILGKNVSVARK